MVITETYKTLYKSLLYSGIKVEKNGHYQTLLEFDGDFFVNEDGSDVIRYFFNVNGCIKKRVIRYKDKKTKEIKTKTLYFKKDKLPVFGTITKNTRFKKFIYKYMLFLKCDGITDKDLMTLYTLKLLKDKMEFWRKKKTVSLDDNNNTIVEYKEWEMYEPEYNDIEKLINGLIKSVKKKEIDEKTRNEFIVKTTCVVNSEMVNKFGGIITKTKNQKLRDARKGSGKSTENKIKRLYDPSKSIKENAVICGVNEKTIQRWKKKHMESTQDRIKRLYDPSKSVKENAAICDVSESSIQRYKRTLPKIEMKTEIEDNKNWIDDLLVEDDYSYEYNKTYKVDDDEEDLLGWLDGLVEEEKVGYGSI